MNRRSLILSIAFTAAWLCISYSAGFCQEAVGRIEAAPTLGAGPGDRVTYSLAQPAGLAVTSLRKETYRLGPGDVLAINVQGRSVIDYPSTTVSVAPTGGVYLPLIGDVEMLGKTVLQVESEIRDRLTKYFKHFTVNVSLVNPRAMYVWIFGEVGNPGLQALPAVATASLSALHAGIRPSGSVRRIEFIRGEKKLTLDLYRIMVLGDLESDFDLQPGDRMYVPLIQRYASITGEVIRGGRYEMVTLSGDSETFRVRDLLGLAIGATPAAALDKAYVERIGPDGKITSIKLDLHDQANSSDADMSLQPGDNLVIPSIAAFQPMIRLIGEFKGDSVYQRALGSSEVRIENKSGIYSLRQGQTVGDVIVATGGVTPQADLKRAYIKRKENGTVRDIPVDLERLLLEGDKTADVALANGDTLVLPALVDRIHIFGDVNQPGSYAYSPNRRLVDYFGNAGGPTHRAKLSEVRIVRGTVDAPRIVRVDVRQAILGSSMESNPILEPGDIVFVPSKFVADWQDAVQMIFTSLSLRSLIRGN